MDTQQITLEVGKGAIETPSQIKAFQYKLAAAAPRVIDWNKGYMVETGFTVPQLDQKSSSSCVAQATCYYGTALLAKQQMGEIEEYSRRHIYSQIYIPPYGGAYIWKGMDIPRKQGFVSLSSVADGNSTEEIMRDSSLNGSGVTEALALNYAQLPRQSIDYLASVVEDHGGFVTGFNGRDDMFLPDGTFTVPSTVDWGHAVWVCGYQMRGGRKCLIIKNSWSSQWGTNGYGFIPEEFVNSGFMFDAYVYASLDDIDPMTIFRVGKTADSNKQWLLTSNGWRFWILDPDTAGRGADKVWKPTAEIVSQADLLKFKYGGQIFIANGDDPLTAVMAAVEEGVVSTPVEPPMVPGPVSVPDKIINQ